MAAVDKSNGWFRGRLQRSPSTHGGNAGRADTVETKPEGHEAVDAAGIATSVEAPKVEAPVENTDPLKQRITAIPRRGLISKVARLLAPKELSAEDKALKDEKARRRQMESLLREESTLYRQRIVNALNRRELCYRFRKSEKDFLTRGVQSVQFQEIRMQPDAVYLRVDTDHMPRGVGILQLVDEDILTDLSIACGRRVSADYSERYGCWYIVERATGVLGIPSHVQWLDMLKGFPSSADGLSLPLGVTSNARPVYKSLGTMYSMLVGGTIGAGKSNVLNVILCTLIRRNHPDRLKLLLVDLKGGLEFSFYEGVPHLLPIPGSAEGGICYHRDQVTGVLKWLLAEGERRIGIMKSAGFKDIGRYNQFHRKQHLPHLVFVVDEWADIKLEPKSGRESEEILTNIAQRFRAVGIHVILCTQVPKSEVLSTRIKGVLPAKLAYSCPTNQGSMAILDNGHAKGLQPVGRCVLQWQDEIQLQTPYINDQMIRETIAGAIAGNFEESDSHTHDLTQLEVLEYALENENGYLAHHSLFAHYEKRGISKEELRQWLIDWEAQEFIVGSSLYRVEPAKGNKPRRLIAVTDNQPEATDQTP